MCLYCLPIDKQLTQSLKLKLLRRHFFALLVEQGGHRIFHSLQNIITNKYDPLTPSGPLQLAKMSICAINYVVQNSPTFLSLYEWFHTAAMPNNL